MIEKIQYLNYHYENLIFFFFFEKCYLVIYVLSFFFSFSTFFFDFCKKIIVGMVYFMNHWMAKKKNEFNKIFLLLSFLFAKVLWLYGNHFDNCTVLQIIVLFILNFNFKTNDLSTKLMILNRFALLMLLLFKKWNEINGRNILKFTIIKIFHLFFFFKSHFRVKIVFEYLNLKIFY